MCKDCISKTCVLYLWAVQYIQGSFKKPNQINYLSHYSFHNDNNEERVFRQNPMVNIMRGGMSLSPLTSIAKSGVNEEL